MSYRTRDDGRWARWAEREPDLEHDDEEAARHTHNRWVQSICDDPRPEYVGGLLQPCSSRTGDWQCDKCRRAFAHHPSVDEPRMTSSFERDPGSAFYGNSF